MEFDPQKLNLLFIFQFIKYIFTFQSNLSVTVLLLLECLGLGIILCTYSEFTESEESRLCAYASKNDTWGGGVVKSISLWMSSFPISTKFLIWEALICIRYASYKFTLYSCPFVKVMHDLKIQGIKLLIKFCYLSNFVFFKIILCFLIFRMFYYFNSS